MAPDRAGWILGGEARCKGVGPAHGREWRIVLLGAPGVGKGTQAELLGARLGACPLSMGDVIRQGRLSVTRGPVMTRALEYMERGVLVPDSTVLALLGERHGCLHCPAGLGFVLDGFPRTVLQAQELQRMLHAREVMLDVVVNYALPAATLVDRLAGRRTCPSCRAVYHMLSKPPRTAGRCDRCATALEHRADDQPVAIRTRMAVYQDTAGPLLAFYQRLGLLLTVPADGGPEEILARTLQAPVFQPLRNQPARTSGA
jgi:adenylate kinase